MLTPTACPTAEALRLLLLGRAADEAETLEDHLALCSACAETAAWVDADDEVVTAVRRAATPDDTPLPPLTDPLRSVFRRMWAADAQAERRADPHRIGPYILSERLGAGGMGVVYRGYDPRLDRAVAIKVIRPGLVPDWLLAEARSAAAVEHDHIVAVHEVEVYDGTPCLVMPLLKGESLERRLRSNPGPLPAAEVRRIGREAASGLAAAHSAGLIHRDVKPANLWLEAPAGRVKLLDFGLAVGDPVRGFAGTPGFMAPEQVRGDAADHRADLFALGCVLYRAATGKPAFPADDPSGAMVRTLTRTPPPAAGVPPRLARLIDRLLSKNPDDRPPTANAVVAELDAIAASERRGADRRRWMGIIAVAAATGGFAVWAAAPTRIDRPAVRVEVVADPDVGVLVLSRDGDEQRFDPAIDSEVLLPPGDYRVRPASEDAGRPLKPDGFTVLPGEPRTVKLAKVGPVAVGMAHTQAVTGVAAAGADVFSAGLDRTLNVWRPWAAETPRFMSLAGPARCLAATTDGKTIATAGGDKQSPRPAVQLWDGATLDPRGEPLDGHTRIVWAVALSPDGQQLVSAAADEVWLWDVAARTKRELVGHDAKVTAATFDAAGKRILTGDEDGRLVLWEAADAGPIKTMTGPCQVRAVAFTPTGFVSAGDDGAVRVWDKASFTSRDLVAGPDAKPIRAIAASADGRRFLAGGDDGMLILWSADGVVQHAFAGHNGPISGVAFTPDGRGAASGGADRTVRLWRLPFD